MERDWAFLNRQTIADSSLLLQSPFRANDNKHQLVEILSPLTKGSTCFPLPLILFTLHHKHKDPAVATCSESVSSCRIDGEPSNKPATERISY